MDRTYSFRLATDRHGTGDVAKAVLWTILFQRLFGSLVPQSGEAIGVTYPKAQNVEAEAEVTERSRELARALRYSESAIVVIEFYERKSKKAAWFAKTYDTCWETWRIEFSLLHQDNSQSQASLDLEQTLFDILGHTDVNKDHIPPITTTDATPFPYKISVLAS